MIEELKEGNALQRLSNEYELRVGVRKTEFQAELQRLSNEHARVT